MHSFTLLSALLSLTTTTTLAYPQPAPAFPTIPGSTPPWQEMPSSPEGPSPTEATVFVCEHVNWGGICEIKHVQIGSGPDLMCNKVDIAASSIGPDKGFTCYFYTNAFCDSVAGDKSDFVEFNYPGAPNLAYTSKGNYNDKFQSFQCIVADPSGGEE